MMNLLRSKAREYALFTVSSFTGLITLEILDGWELRFADGLLSLLNIDTIRYDTRCYFNVRSKADISQLNLPHGTDN